LDGSTSYGHHQIRPGGLMQYGHSKDHRPDLPQLKLMAAAAAPWGHLIACDVLPGQQSDDRLYLPLLERVWAILGPKGLLYTGDCKMAALEIRAHLVWHEDYYVVPLPLTGKTGDLLAEAVRLLVLGPPAETAGLGEWAQAMLPGLTEIPLLWDGERLLGAGYEFERTQTAIVEGQTLTWTERVQIVRSPEQAQRRQADLERRLAQATAALQALTPAPGRGKRQIREEAALQAAIQRVQEQYRVGGLLQVTWERQEQTVTRYQGRGRGGANRPTYTETEVRYQITSVPRQEQAIAEHCWQLGWRVQVTNAPVEKLPLAGAVREGRGGWSLERDFHLVKDLPLGLSPLFVWKNDQITGLTRLLTLALRLLTLMEIQVRQALAQEQETLPGLYEGQPHRTTAHPTGKRLLQAFARAKITLTWVETILFAEEPNAEASETRAESPGPKKVKTETVAHITPLSPLLERVLHYLRLPPSLYTDLAHNTS